MVFNEGGMGDFLNYSAAIVWLDKNCPWIDGRLYSPAYLVPMLKEILAGAKHWRVFESENFHKTMEPGTALVCPGMRKNGEPVATQYVTCLGSHPFDLGFAYYAGLNPPPLGAVLPVLDFLASSLQPKIKRLIGQYAVITTGATGYSRVVLGRHLKPVLEHLKSKSITPVFLGKRDLLNNGVTSTRYAEDIDFEMGLDMRDQTSVKDAAAIMQHALFTLGLDNGLLHLAALMKDSKIIFGYNITSV